jgi:hypothetical protein
VGEEGEEDRESKGDGDGSQQVMDKGEKREKKRGTSLIIAFPFI